LLIAYVELSLQENSTDLSDEATREFLESLTFVVLDIALKTGREEILFGQIYEKYVECEVDSVFLDSLTPHILAGALKTSLNASVVNAYIDQQVKAGRFELVEQILTNLDAMTLDLNTVIKVCLTHHLFSGLIYLYNQAFKDYVTPVFELLKVVRKFNEIKAGHPEWALDNIPDKEAKSLRDNCYQLLVYLAYTWTGKGYPAGLIPDADQLSAKSALFKLVFSEVFSQGDSMPYFPPSYPSLFNPRILFIRINFTSYCEEGTSFPVLALAYQF
jgi:hypothetical protein